MNQLRQQRAWIWIAAIAILAAIVLLLVPHAHSENAAHMLAILPVLFVGFISPLNLFISIDCLQLGHLLEVPQLPSTSQRPPPFRRG